MALYAVTCLDKPGSLELRLANRPDHLAYAQTSGKVRLAGPFLDADEKPCGSLLLIEAGSLEEAQGFAAADPYAKAGLFSEVSVRPWRPAIGGFAD